MTWTYDGLPGPDTADGRRDAVRLLVGDTDTNDQQITDEEIAFYLSEANDRIYYAAAGACRGIAAKYARLVTNSIDSASVELGQRQEHYAKLARHLEREAKSKGGGLGIPKFGGVSKDDMRANDENEDRVDPAFRTRQFRNPPRFADDDLDDYA